MRFGDNYINEENKPIVLGWTRDEKGNVVDRHPVDVANAVTSGKRDNTQNYVVEEDPKIVASRGRGDGWKQQLEERTDGITNTITGVQKDNMVHNNCRIRKLTPRECFRLMGVSDRDIDILLNAGISNSQLYKLAGNSIVVNCLAAIFYQLFIGNQNKNQQLEIF